MKPRTWSRTASARILVVLAAIFVGLLVGVARAEAADLLRNNGFERSTTGWTGARSKLKRVSPGLRSDGAGRVAPAGTRRSATARQATGRVTVHGRRYEASVWARGREGAKLCLLVRERRHGSLVGVEKACARATGRWQHLPLVRYRARRDGSRLVVSLRESGAARHSAFRIDRSSLRRVKRPRPAPSDGSTDGGTTDGGTTDPGSTGGGTTADVVKLLDSRNAGTTDCTEGGGTLSRGGLGDTFFIPEQSTVSTSRCTWVDSQFSRMGRYEVFDLDLRWDEYAEADSSHAGVLYVRPTGANLSSGCDGGGNTENIVVRLFVDRAATPDRWTVDLRGGVSPWPVDQSANFARVPLGPVVQGEVQNVKVSAFFNYAHGSVTVWSSGVQVYSDLDRPLGFQYDCTYRSSADGAPNPAATDISAKDLRAQHGIYRNATPAWRLTSSGVRFYCSQTTPC